MDLRKLKSKNQENKVAKELSGRVTPASGALWGSKGDVKSDKFLVECKTTEKEFYTLTFNVWDKIYREAIKEGLRIPVMCIDIMNGKKRFAVMYTPDLPEEVANSIPASNSEGMSFRVSYEQRKFLSKRGKCYNLSVISWQTFLEEVVKSA